MRVPLNAPLPNTVVVIGELLTANVKSGLAVSVRVNVFVFAAGAGLVTAFAETVRAKLLTALAPAVPIVRVVNVVPDGTGLGENVQVTLVGAFGQPNWRLSEKLLEGTIVVVTVPEFGMLMLVLVGFRLKLKSTTFSVTGCGESTASVPSVP